MLTIKKEWRRALAEPLSVGHDSYLSPSANIVIIYKTAKNMSTVLPLRINTNVNGIPRVSSQSVSVNTAGDTVAFDFQNHPTIGGPFVGWITVRLAQAVPTGTADTAEIVFTSEGSNRITAFGYDEEPLTVANLRGTGIYLFFFDGNTNYLQLVTGNFI